MATRLDTRVPPPVWTLGMAAAQWLLAGCPDYRRRPGPARFFFAGTVGTLSAVVGIAAVQEFVARGTTVHPGSPEHASVLVTDRIYQYTRNPMYLGFFLFLAGWAALLSNLVAFALLPAFIAYMNRFQIQPEERALTQQFGTEFQSYMQRVRRWV